ncbi:MAG: hypothetical protein GVY24_06450 [Planctomycetes bacterium]|jgi:parallel beta-helix repeat protein|nr:hypothetical protein [Planctomycetota bacterium]
MASTTTSTSATTRTLHVAQSHTNASDQNDGSAERPFATIQAAAERVEPGDTVLIYEGVYRERVCPARGGEPDRPITFQAAPGQTVCLRGSEPFAPDWHGLKDCPGVFVGSLEGVVFGAEAYQGRCDPQLYGDFNPFHLNFNRELIARPHEAVVADVRARLEKARQSVADQTPDDGRSYTRAVESVERLEADLERCTHTEGLRYRTTLGQIFIDGAPLNEVETIEELRHQPGTWMVNPEGDALWVHPLEDQSPLEEREVEISVRHTVFSPLQRGLGHIHVRGLIFEHAANYFPTWGDTAWGQAGMLSTRSGHHWVIEHNTVRWAKSVGIDCGSEGGANHCEFKPDWQYAEVDFRELPQTKHCGFHVIRDNVICDNGHCGIAGIGHYGTKMLHNVIERNNRDGWTSPYWEFAGIKVHFFYDGLIEGNLIRDNEAHGIWIDNQWRGSRITRNVIVNNQWSGINVEYGRGPCLIDNNVIAHTRHGDGLYGHDVADVTMAHNLVYANARFGVWFAYGTPRVKPEDGCWQIRTLNNLIFSNGSGAIAYSLPWHKAGDNHADGNLFMGAGEYLDEGSGPPPPLFQINNKSHVGQMPRFDSHAQTPEVVAKAFGQRLTEAGVPEEHWPNLELWKQHFMVNLDLWRATMGCDQHSAVQSVIKDGLSTTRLGWQCDITDALGEVTCQPVDGVDKDFFGQPMPRAGLLPGPFQNLKIGRNHLLFWPVRRGD